MTEKPTYEELEQRIKALEQRVVSGINTINVSGINMAWKVDQGRCTFEDLPVAMMWIDTTLAGLMSGVQAMVGTDRFGLALQSEGRKSVEDDWKVISQFPEFKDGFKAIANIGAVAGWGDWELIALDEKKKECQFRVKDSWEGLYQKTLGVCWSSGMLAGKMAGYCSKLFNTNCWADQTAFFAKGDKYDEFVVRPSERLIEKEIENLLATDEATRADMAVALQKLRGEVEVRQRAEEALRKSEDKYRLLAENVSDVIWVRDMNLNLTYISPSVKDQQGYTVEEAMNRTPEEIFSPDSLKFIGEVLTEELEIEKQEKKDLARSRTLEVEVKCKDGSTIWSEAKMSFLHDQDSHPTGIIGVTRDISERKRAEEALRESESKFRNLFDLSPQAVALTEIKSGRLVDINNKFCELTKYTKEEVIGLNTTEVGFYLEADRSKFLKELQASGEVNGLDMQFKAKDHSILHTIMFARIIQIEGKSFILTIFHDITEQKRLEAQLQQAQRMEAIGTFAGGVAHDLNNILSGIVSYPELILMDLPEGSPLRKPILTIQKSGEKAAVIVQDLLTLARRGVSITDVVNLNHIISEQLKSPEFEKLISFHPDVQVKTNLEKNLLNIKGSSTHLSKAVMNIISNAAEAMLGGGTILVSTENLYLDRPIKGYNYVESGEYVTVTVSDTAMGIPEEDLKRIFEPFYTKKVMGRSGTGLGMAVVWGTVKDYKGYIDIQSKVGKGTTCTLYFPVTRKEIAEYEPILPIVDYMGKGALILVIDDVEEQREIATGMLMKLGYSVTSVSSGEEAVEYLKTNSADLIVLDMIMEPGINGRETYERIINLHPNQKAIIASGFSETNDVKAAQKLGAGQYIKKPYSLEKIGIAVKDELKK